uniref:Vitellogenin domain-containing protein n=1 Tax=Heliothis virescens TaxID=7102 RepID=A0A2A4JFI3_HELVI
MKLLLLTAFIAAVAASPLAENSKWPWQVGQQYSYNVQTYGWTRFENSNNTGSGFTAQLIIRVKASGHLVAKLVSPSYGQFNQAFDINDDIPEFEVDEVDNLDQPIEIFVDGGRVLSLKVPSSLSTYNENLYKGIISALQVDLSTVGHVHSFPNSYDKETFQGLFKKIETDVTGECETLYTVSPSSAEVHRLLPSFAENDDVIEIAKSKNYGACNKKLGGAYGMPDGAVWEGITYDNEKKQIIEHSSQGRIIVGKKGSIYRSEVLSSVFVNPLLFGKQKAEVYSYVVLSLSSVDKVDDVEWKNAEELREVDSLLYADSEETFGTVELSVVNAQKVLQDITPLLQDPSNLSKADFLTKFNTLVRLIMSMNPEQVAQMTSSVDVAKDSNNVAKSNMWIIYRDAVAQAGSISAFKEIQKWILNKKIQGEEAAEVIASLASSLIFEVKRNAVEFVDLAFNPVVTEQKYLNTSALLAATKFVRKSKQNLVAVEKVIPYLSKELKKAVEAGDSHKAQVYIRSLGNLAIPEILEVFAPYLDGSIPTSKYLRIQIVISLKTLANLKDESVRAVLFSLLKNTAEPYEVRVAAALNIFLSSPNFEMMQLMALMTQYDPSTQVRGVLATSIGFAANLKDPRFAELAKTAQSVLKFVANEKFGYRYSGDSIIDEYTNNEEIAHFRELSFIGSVNNGLPIYQRNALRLRGTGLSEESWFTLSVSDVQRLFDFLKDYFFVNNKSKGELKFSAKDVAEKLNIKRDTVKPIEAAYFIDNLNQQRLFTFSESEFAALFEQFEVAAAKLMTGIDTQFTKIVVDKQVTVVFPIASGVPFVFTYNEPIVLNLQVKANSKLAYSLNVDLKFTYARNLDGSVGFFDPLSGTFANSGIVNKLQLYIPAKFKVNGQLADLKVALELPEVDANLVHLSVSPYTTRQLLLSPVSVFEDPDTKLVERSQAVVSTDINLGKLAGVGLYLKGHSYSNDYNKLFDADILTNVRDLLYQKDVACTHFDLKYVAKDTKNKEVSTSIFNDVKYNQKVEGKLGAASIPSDISANSAKRRQELSDRVASGIDAAKVRLLDISTVFDGQEKVEFLLTAAWANSVSDSKFQAAVFALAGSEQVNAVLKVKEPQIAALNFEEAIKNEIRVQYEADFKFGTSDNINIKGIGERSEKYTERLKKDPLAKQCLEDSSKNNFYQKSCYKLIIKAHAPDYFKATVTYKELDPVLLQAADGIYDLYKHFTTWEEEEDYTKTLKDGTIELEAQAYYYDNYIDYKFNTKYGAFYINHAEGQSHYPYTIAIYLPTTKWERSYNWFTGYQTMPYCAVDTSKIHTFSGRNYDYSLTGSWHAVMLDENNQFNPLVVLARRPNENEEEIYFSYTTPSGKYLEAYITPDGVEVQTDAEKLKDGDHTIYWDNAAHSVLLEYYPLGGNIQVFTIDGEAIRIVYDNQRLVIFTAEHRSTTRGICGQSSSEDRDDYLTPYGLVDSGNLYGASFALSTEDSDAKTEELKKEAKLKAYQPVTKYTNILRSDAEWSKVANESHKE